MFATRSQWLALFAAAAMMAAAGALHSQPPASPTPPAQPETSMVWVSRTGTKYHSDESCSNMIDPVYMPLEQALEIGRKPCKKCY